MNATEVRAAVLDVLGTVAPEARRVEIRPEVNFREQFDFDSYAETSVESSRKLL